MIRDTIQISPVPLWCAWTVTQGSDSKLAVHFYVINSIKKEPSFDVLLSVVNPYYIAYYLPHFDAVLSLMTYVSN
jgi:hypothetical protein